MNKSLKNALCVFVILAAAVALSACGNAATPEPTPDMDAFATSAVQTVEARYTETALAMPTETPAPTYTPVSLPTATADSAVLVLPTSEEMITNDAAAASTGTDASAAAASASGDAAAVAAVVPTATTAASSSTGNKASYEGQTPTDGTHVKAGEEFDITWYLVNTGTTTWTTDYSMRYFTGTNFSKPGKTYYRLNNAVAPNETGACSMDAVAPTTPGTYQMSAVLANENDENFMIVDITIVVD